MNASRGVAAIGVASTMPWLELDRWLNRFLIRCKQRLTGQPLVVARHVMPAKPLNLIALYVSVLILKMQQRPKLEAGIRDRDAYSIVAGLLLSFG